jgi:hypothetical protein
MVVRIAEEAQPPCRAASTSVAGVGLGRPIWSMAFVRLLIRSWDLAGFGLARGGLLVRLLAERPPRLAEGLVQPLPNPLVLGPKSLGLLKQVS